MISGYSWKAADEILVRAQSSDKVSPTDRMISPGDIMPALIELISNMALGPGSHAFSPVGPLLEILPTPIFACVLAGSSVKMENKQRCYLCGVAIAEMGVGGGGGKP